VFGQSGGNSTCPGTKYIHQRKEPSQKGTKKETALPNPQSLPRRSFPRGRRLPLPPERLQRFTFELAGKNCSNGSSTQGGGAVGHARKAARGTASGRLRSRRSAVSAGSSVGGLSSSPKSWWRWRHRREIGKGGHRGAGQTACLSSTSTSATKRSASKPISFRFDVILFTWSKQLSVSEVRLLFLCPVFQCLNSANSLLLVCV
jgi:hypothetical protein